MSIVEIYKKGWGNWSNFLLYMNLDEISAKYLAIFIIYKYEKLCYNTSCRGTHGPISVSTQERSITVIYLKAKCQSHGINHAQVISCYAFFVFVVLNKKYQ